MGLPVCVVDAFAGNPAAVVFLDEPRDDTWRLSVSSEFNLSETAFLFTDEASFRQDSTLHATWARIGCQPQVPVTGQRKSIKIFGAVAVYTSRFLYKRDTVFNADTYGGFLEDIAHKFRRKGALLVQDNASYHKAKEIWSWFKSNRHWLEVYQLPPYSPEFNATVKKELQRRYPRHPWPSML